MGRLQGCVETEEEVLIEELLLLLLVPGAARRAGVFEARLDFAECTATPPATPPMAIPGNEPLNL